MLDVATIQDDHSAPVHYALLHSPHGRWLVDLDYGKLVVIPLSLSQLFLEEPECLELGVHEHGTKLRLLKDNHVLDAHTVPRETLEQPRLHMFIRR